MSQYKTVDEKKLIESFLATFDLQSESEKDLAKRIIDYIIRQLNDESMKGYLYYSDYQIITEKGVDGLFKEVYLNSFDYEDRSRRYAKLMRYDVIFASSLNFFLMLMTRINLGRDRELIIKEIESKRQVLFTK